MNQPLSGEAKSESNQRPYEEKTVTEIRACLHINDIAGAHRNFALLTAKLSTRIKNAAYDALHGYGRDLPAEGFSEAVLLLWRRISEAKPDKTLHLEVRFNQAFTKLLIDAFRIVRTRRYGLIESLDAEATAETNEGKTTGSLVYDAPDPHWKTALSLVLGVPTVSALLSHVPDERWAEALQMELDGCGRDEIADHFGVTVKTVYNWTEKAKATLKAHMLETYPLDCHGLPILK